MPVHAKIHCHINHIIQYLAAHANVKQGVFYTGGIF